MKSIYMYFFTVSAAIISTIFIVMAAYLYKNSPKNILSRIFITYLLVCSAWISTNCMADVANSHELLFFWSGTAIILGSAVVSMYIAFIYVHITQQSLTPKKWLLFFSPTVVIAAFAYTPHSIQNTVLFTTQPNTIEPGILYTFAFVTLTIILITSLIILIKQIFKESGTRKLQTIYITIGFTSVIIGQLVFDLILPLLGEVRFYNLGPQFAAVFAACTSYAMWRHNLLNLKILIQRSLIYAFIFGFIVSIYALIVSVIANSYSLANHTTLNIAVGVASILLSLAIIPRLDKYLRKTTDRLFFSDTYEYRKALHELSQALNESTNLSSIIKLSENKLASILRASFVRVSTRTPDKEYRLAIAIPHNPKIKIFLGTKLSGAAYTADDELLLQTFANQVSVAISRASLFQDIKDRADELETRVQERTQELHTLQQTQKSLMLQLTHNLQTPLAILLNRIERLKGTIEAKHFLPLEQSVNEVSGFITRLLHLARLENADYANDKKAFSLSDLLTDIIEEVNVIADDRGIAINTSITPDVMINGDFTTIREAVQNIISNAIKYSSEKQAIKFCLTAKKGHASIECTNYGSIISKQDLGNIFTPFYRSISHTDIKGTGLGLAITKQIIEHHNGSIIAKSSLKTGTSFIITLPTI